jgi:hypothetical protein
MPLDVTLLAADGTVLDRVQKSALGGVTRVIEDFANEIGL